MLIVIEHDSFVKQAKKNLNGRATRRAYRFISVYYDQGSVVNGTGGVQKIRFAHQTGKGKSGAARIIYLVVNEKHCVHLLDIFEKNVKENLSAAEKNALKKLVVVLKNRRKSHV